MIRRALLYILMLQAGVLAGCAVTQPPSYYLLNPMPSPHEPGVKEGPCITIGMLPVEIPRYLQRPQIMVRTGANELAVSEFNLWAEPLEENIYRVISKNLETLLCANVLEIRPGMLRQTADYRLDINIVRMDGRLGDDAVLQAVWSITRGAGTRALLMRKSRFTGDAGRDHASLVSALEGLLAELSREIAAACASLPQVRQAPASPPAGAGTRDSGAHR